MKEKEIEEFLNNIKKEGIKITEENIEIIRQFVNFELYKNINDKEKWKKGELWFRNPRYPREYKKKIKALIKVKEIIDLEYQWYLAIIKREEEKEIEEKTLKEY